jgi:uncharacterized protein (TIGR03790 family)
MTKLLGCGLFLVAAVALAATGGESVVVVYNKNLPESKKLAEYYAEKRAVPSSQLFGVDVTAISESMSRAEFQDKLQNPLFNWLVKQKLFTRNPKKPQKSDPQYRPIIGAKIRYIVLCYGVPLTIARDNAWKEETPDKMIDVLRGRNEAAVDADLALLPVSQNSFLLTGPQANPFYLGTNGAALHPTNGIVMVTRLDGPSVDIARGLVDKALQAETNGLWGRAYFDARGITPNDPALKDFKVGDDWMKGAAVMTRRMGFDTVLDENESTFSAGFPMSHVAFYAGWYDLHASGPFARREVEFMPGAFAYHLHSLSARTVRSANQHWCGPLLANGATITMGSVDEPYLSGTPNIAAFVERLVYRRWKFGEAAYICQGTLSWQTTVIGDPLYQPFAQPPEVVHFKLERERNPLIEWSHMRVVGLNLATGLGADELIKYLKDIPLTTNSAVLMQQLGDLQRGLLQLSEARDSYDKALKLRPSPQQKIRLLLTIAELETERGRDQAALDAYKQIVVGTPDYPGAFVYERLAALSRKLGKNDDAKKFTQQAELLKNRK